MPRILILTAVCAFLGCPRPAVSPDPTPEVTRPELWVDPGIARSGDGTRASPLRSLEEALRKDGGPLIVWLAPGSYRGPFEPRDGLRLIGSGETVLFVEGDATVLTPSGRLELENLTVRGGGTGIASAHPLNLTNVAVVGQGETGIVLDGGGLRCEACRFDASVADSTGVRATRAAEVELSGTRFAGPYRRGLHLEEGTRGRVRDTVFEGSATAVQAIRADLALSRVQVSGGRVAGVFGSGGTLTFEDVEVTGGEYAIVIRDGAEVKMDGVRLFRPERAALALVNVNARIDGLQITKTGGFGGIHQLGGDLQLTHFTIQAPDAYGINGAAARLRIRNGRIIGVTDVGGAAGDAVHLRRSRAVIEDLTVEETAGSAVLAAEGSEVAVRGLTTRRNQWGAVLAETGAHVEVVKLSAGAVPHVVSVPGDALVKVDGLVAENVGSAWVWADCEKGAGVLLAGVEGKVGEVGACVGVWSSPGLFDPLAKPGAISSEAASTP